MTSKQDVRDRLYEKLKHLSETVWDHKAKRPEIDRWVSQFAEAVDVQDDEQLQALYLLSNFVYFGQTEIRALLVSLFRDLFRTPLIHEIRRTLGDTTDVSQLVSEFGARLSRTRFLGVGNPSESGVHLLYFFRQENSLPKTAFINSHEIFRREGGSAGTSTVVLRDDQIQHYVFIDDLCGSGTQAEQYSRDLVDPIKALNPHARVHYLVLFATDTGLQAVRNLNRYDQVDSLFELDASFKCLEPGSRIFEAPDQIFDRAKVRATSLAKGSQLWPPHPLGYKDGQLLLGFNHNTPDNTLPIFWIERPPPVPWEPIFKRYHKID